MEPVSLWAAVEFTACNGSTEALLTAAARAGLHPYGVTASEFYITNVKLISNYD